MNSDRASRRSNVHILHALWINPACFSLLSEIFSLLSFFLLTTVVGSDTKTIDPTQRQPCVVPI